VVALLGALTLIGIATSACTRRTPSTPEIALAIWANYITDADLARFEKETGAKVRVSNFASNEELLAKVQSGGSGIDVAVPSDYMVEVMNGMGLLANLNPAQIPALESVSPAFRKQAFDPENKVSVPYAWTVAGMVVNTDRVKGELASWKDVVARPELKGRVSLLDDAREVLGLGLKTSGFSVNSTSESELAAASRFVSQLRPMVRFFRSDVIDPLVAGEVWVAQAYSSDALKAAGKAGAPKLKFVIPKEGATRAIDNLVVLKGSPRQELAHRLINFLVTEDVARSRAVELKAGPVHAKNLTDFPVVASAEQMVALETLQDLGEFVSKLDRTWTEIKMGQSDKP
jgi:spermidine/putrescine transport system substrate-binding protein